MNTYAVTITVTGIHVYDYLIENADAMHRPEHGPITHADPVLIGLPVRRGRTIPIDRDGEVTYATHVTARTARNAIDAALAELDTYKPARELLAVAERNMLIAIERIR